MTNRNASTSRWSPLRAIREWFYVARCVRAIRKASRPKSKGSPARHVQKLVLCNSKRSERALQKLYDNPKIRVSGDWQSEIATDEIEVVFAILRGRRLPWLFREGALRALAVQHVARESVQQFLIELLEPDSPEQDSVIQTLCGPVQSLWNTSREVRASLLQTLVRGAPEAAQVRKLPKSIPATMDPHTDALLTVWRGLILDESIPLAVREPILQQIYARFNSHALIRSLIDDVMVSGPETLFPILLNAMSSRGDCPSPSATSRLVELMRLGDTNTRLNVAKMLALGGDQRGVDYILCLTRLDSSLFYCLRATADGRCAQPALKALQRDHSDCQALDLLEQCLIRDPTGVPKSALKVILKLPARITKIDEYHPFQPCESETETERERMRYMYENSPVRPDPPPAEPTITERLIRDNSKLLALAKAEIARRGAEPRTQSRGRRS